MILLITPNQDLVDNIRNNLLLPPARLVVTTSLAEAEPYLSLAPASERPQAVLIDAFLGGEQVAECRRICTDVVPIIAIITDPTMRQEVLEAGADDYLLHPFARAEIRARLAPHLDIPYLSYSNLLESISQSNPASFLKQDFDQGLKLVAQIFQAPAAWLLLFDPDRAQVKLVSTYNLPPLLEPGQVLVEETVECLDKLQQATTDLPQVIACPRLIDNPQQAAGLTHHLSIQLISSGPREAEGSSIGILNLAYQGPPQLTRTEKRMLVRLGQDMGYLLNILDLRQEAETHAAQNAFVILLARILGERLELNATLALTLEQAVPLVNASGGNIRLVSSDGRWLELASSLSHQLSDADRQSSRWPMGQGLTGWVAEHGRASQIDLPTADPRFDPEVDQPQDISEYSLLVVPLRHRETTIGVLSLYHTRSFSFSDQDQALLEGIASLTASAIVNARLMQELRDYADQQRILYEMSQQIAAGLTLHSTLKRVLQWIGRLFEVEIGLLWFLEETVSPENEVATLLRLVASLGVDLPPDEQITMSMDVGLTSWVAQTGEALIVNDPASHPKIDRTVIRSLNLVPRNFLAVPMVHHGQIIGVICLLNKIGAPFTEDDRTLLTTAVDMVAVAVGNARLHTQTVALVAEKEQLYQQMLQSERMATIGRLTASLSHEINNPMQAIQGALTLALEELDDPKEVAMYLRMSLEETERVVQLISRLRQIYRPQAESHEVLNLNDLLEGAIAIARKELKRHKVTLQIDLAPELPPIMAIASQMHLVCLSLILNLSDLIKTQGGGSLQIRSRALANKIVLEFSTDVPTITLKDWRLLFRPETPQNEVTTSLGLSLSYDIIAAHNGALHLSQEEQELVCKIEFPLSSVNVTTE